MKVKLSLNKKFLLWTAGEDEEGRTPIWGEEMTYVLISNTLYSLEYGKANKVRIVPSTKGGQNRARDLLYEDYKKINVGEPLKVEPRLLS